MFNTSGVFPLSTCSNQTCRKRNDSCGVAMATVCLCYYPFEQGLHLSCAVLLPCHRALLKGSSDCSQTSYRNTQEVLLCLTCMSSCPGQGVVSQSQFHGLTSSGLRADLGDLLHPNLVLSQPFSCVSGYKGTKQGKGSQMTEEGESLHTSCVSISISVSAYLDGRPGSPQTGAEMLLGLEWPLTQTLKHID